MTGTSCPIGDELLHDYFAGDLAREQSESVEEHVFSCDRCARAFERCGALAADLRSLIPPVISRDFLDRIVARGETVRLTPVAAGQLVAIEFSRDVSYLVHALRADLTGATELSVRIHGSGSAVARIELHNVPFDAERGEVLIACQRHYMESFPPRVHFHVTATIDGDRREIGEYVIDHLMPA